MSDLVPFGDFHATSDVVTVDRPADDTIKSASLHPLKEAPFVFDPAATYLDQNVQAWAQYYAQGGTDPAGSVYFISVPGITDARSSPTAALHPQQPQGGQVEQQQQVLGSPETRAHLQRQSSLPASESEASISPIVQNSRDITSTLSKPKASAPPIFFGRDAELTQILDMVFGSLPARIAILGPGGYGKTTLANSLLAHSRIRQRFGDARYFIPCESATTSEGLLIELAKALGFLNAGRNATWPYIKAALKLNECIICLDNFESPWDQAAEIRNSVEELLSQIASLRNVTVLVTMRGLVRPARTRWTQPFLAPLRSLDNGAAQVAWQRMQETAEASNNDVVALLETDSFIYSPSFASSEASITSYKTERTINSRTSRYNDPPRRKYTDIGQLRHPQGLVSLDADGTSASKTQLRNEFLSTPLRTLPVQDIYRKANLVQESLNRPASSRSDSILSSLSLLPPAEGDDQDITSSDDETVQVLHAPSTPTIGLSALPSRVFTSPSFCPSYLSIGSTANSALILVASLQPASSTPCSTCAQPLIGETVYAIGALHHLGCFKCTDCGVVVASKFFIIESGGSQRPLCETDHSRRLDNLCEKCGLVVRGNYVTAFEKQWHLEHFTCVICSTVLAPTDSHYENAGQQYCRQHYLTGFTRKCTGCSSEILKDYVNTAHHSCWHLECYMIRKFWNLNFVSKQADESSITTGQTHREKKDHDMARQSEWQHIWTVLNTYENESAACIFDVLLEVTNGRYVAAIRILERLLLSVEVLFAATDDLEYKFALPNGADGIPYIKVARALCHAFLEVFTFVSEHQRSQSMEQRATATLGLLKEVAGISRCVNSLIGIALRCALELQHNPLIPGVLASFLDKLHAITSVNSSGHRPTATMGVAGAVTKVELTEHVNPAARSHSCGYRSLAPENAGISPLTKAQKKYKPPTDLCVECKLTIAEACVRLGTYQRWHLHCLRCQSCDKAAYLPSMMGPSTTSTGVHTQVDVNDFLYEPMSIKNVPLVGPVPSVVYCTDHAWPTSRSGFLPVSLLEQYAYLLTVSLRRLYAHLKDPILASQTFVSPWDESGGKGDRIAARNSELVQDE